MRVDLHKLYKTYISVNNQVIKCKYINNFCIYINNFRISNSNIQQNSIKYIKLSKINLKRKHFKRYSNNFISFHSKDFMACNWVTSLYYS